MKNSYNLKTMFTLFLAAPFLVLIVMIFIFAGLVEGRNTTSDLLQAPKYMIDPIGDIIANNYRYTEQSDGVLLLLDNKGAILYPLEDKNISTGNIELSQLYNKLVYSDIETISMSKYIYDGIPGFCFFDNTHIPVMLKQHIRIGVSLFIVIISCMGLIFGRVSHSNY